MANFFSLQDGNVTDPSVYGYSLTGAEIMNNTTGVMLLTSGGLYSANGFSDGSTISAIAVHLSARNSNPTGTLALTLQRTASAGTFFDSSSSNFVVTTLGTAIQNNFTPFSPNGWSGYFNTSTGGTVGYSGTTNAAVFGTLDFTIECWIYSTGLNTNGDAIIDTRNADNNSATGLYFGLFTNRYIRAFTGTSGIVSAGPIPVGVWTHIALTRSGTNMSLYVNGISSAGATNSSNFTDTAFRIGYGCFTSSGLFGLMSNLRIVKGTAIYTSNFTPSTSKLTAITNTSLLTLQDNRIKDNSSNNITLTAVNGNPVIKDVSPFTPVYVDPNIYGGSLYLDNTVINNNSYLSTPQNAIFGFPSNTFTIECWAYFTKPNIAQALVANWQNSTNGWSIQMNSSNKILVAMAGDGAIITSTNNFPLNQWNHVAVAGTTTSYRLYINGNLEATGTTTAVLSSNNGVRVGDINLTAVQRLSAGYISNVRLINGTALYTSNFTPSTSPLTNVAGTSLLLNTNNYGLKNTVTETYAISGFTSYDGSNNLLTPYPQNWQILKLTSPLSTYNGDVLNYNLSTSSPNQLSLMGAATAINTTGVNAISTVGTPSLTSFKPYTNFDDSWFLNGSNSWFVSPPNTNFNFSGDFTIECWVNASNFTQDPTNTNRRIFGFGTANSTNNLELVYGTTASPSNLCCLYNGAQLVNGTIPVIDGNWHHIAAVRYNNTLKLFVDGVQSGPSVTSTTSFSAGVVNPLTIGAINNTATGRLSGYINQFRIVNGTAVYTTSAFTPPTTSLTIIPNTVFLLKNGARYDQALISNTSVLNGVLTLNGTQLSSASPFGSGIDGSIKFNGTSDYITISNPNGLSYSGTGDFTFESWIYTNDPQWMLYANAVSTGLGIGYNVDNSAQGLGIWKCGVGADVITGVSNTAVSGLSSNTWQHIAVTRISNIVRFFINGKLIASPTSTQSYVNAAQSYIGRDGVSSILYFSGLISNLRFINGFGEYITDFIPSTNPLYPKVGTLTFINASSYNSSIYKYFSQSLGDFHIGSALKGLNTESRTITVDTYVSNNLYIHNQGSLSFPLTSSKTLTLNGSAGLQITSDGTLNVGTSSAVVPLSTTHTIVLSNTQIDVHNGGNLNVYGYPKLFTTNLVNDTVSGSKTFTTVDNVSSVWNVGDVLVYKPNLTNRISFDTLILSSFTASNTFTTTLTSLFTHIGSSAYANVPGVFNLSRNVIIRGADASNRGSIRTINSAKTSINYAQLSNFGINAVNKTGLVLGNNLNGSTILSGSAIHSDNTSNVNNIAPLTGRIFQNVTINNNIINKSNIIALTSLSTNNVNINNNYILSSGGIGLQISNSTGSINMSNNTTIGSLSYGTYIANNTLTGTYGANNFNSNAQGMYVVGTNTGTIVGGGINSAKEGVYVDASTGSLSGVTFQNILANNNSSVGFKVSGNSLNTVNLNINGLVANTNADLGFEGYNITGNLCSIVANNNSLSNNLNTAIRTSIGNGSTVFDGISSYTNTSNYALCSFTTVVTAPTISDNSPYSEIPYSFSFNGGGYASSDTSLVFGSIFTWEAWVYVPAVNPINLMNRIDVPAAGGGSSISLNGSNQLAFDVNSSPSSSQTFTSVSAVPVKVWTHLAMTRDAANDLRFYQNGILTNTINTAAVNTRTAITMKIGLTYSNAAGNAFLVTNMRLVTGSALYTTANFNPSASVIAPIPGTVFFMKAPNIGYQVPIKGSETYSLNILSAYNYSKTVIRNAMLTAYSIDPSLSASIALNMSNVNKLEEFRLETATLSAGIPFKIATTRPKLEGSYLFSNSNSDKYGLSSLALTGYQSDTFLESGIAVMRENGLSGNHYRLNAAGKVSYDKVNVRTSGNYASEKLEPTSTTVNLRSVSKYISVQAGASLTVKAYVYKSAGYTGSAPRLILKRNSTLGFNDTVLATSVAANGTWESLAGTTPTSLTFGTFEVYVECSGSVGCGSINIDDWDFS